MQGYVDVWRRVVDGDSSCGDCRNASHLLRLDVACCKLPNPRGGIFRAGMSSNRSMVIMV